MEIRVSATRMQLLATRKRLVMAERGHKLLKDKLDELMKHFLELIRTEHGLREEVEDALVHALPGFLEARATMSNELMEAALLVSRAQSKIDAASRNIMNIKVPELTWVIGEVQDVYPYGFYRTSAALDDAVEGLTMIMPKLVKLAEVEKSIELLASELERTRRRVNALEYVVIPNLKETVRYVVMKLDEAERGNLTRLMKVKEIVKEKRA
ncbi:MAG: V-type ATP synthase subunit D [Firmicutes bacterium]|nr:V-type ATP synthase subunit D [Bacillota bacterium]